MQATEPIGQRALTEVVDVEELHRVALAHISDLLIITDDHGSLVYVSPRVSDILGYDVSAALALGNIDRLLGVGLHHSAALDRDREARSIEHYTTDSFRRTRVLLINVKRIAVRNGTLLYNCRDITERKLAEAELDRERHYGKYIVDAAPFLVVAIGPDGTTEFVNPMVTYTTGYAPDELIGRNWWHIFYPGEEYAQVEKLLADFDNFRVRDYEMTLTTKDGRKRIISWNSANVLDAKKRPTTIIGLGSDVTDRKRLEDELRQSQKMESIGRLAGGIAHDFNNLLTIILGNGELVAESVDFSRTDPEPFRQMVEAATRAATLTQQLLAFSRHQALDPQILDFNCLVNGFIPLLSRLVGEDITIQTRLAEELGTVRVDPAKFEQVLLNLVVNARDAMPTGGIVLLESANVDFADACAAPAPDIGAGHFIQLSVTDTGIGMTEEVRGRLFEPFFTTKELGRGTGMGLATVFGAVKQSGGAIAVESKPLCGTTFRIYLPIVSDSTLVTNDGEDLIPTDSEVKGATVLVAEDDAVLRQVTKKMLESEGFVVLEAATGEEALEVANSYPKSVDLLLTDVVMPNMGGCELADRLTAMQASLKVLFLSGYTEQRVVSSSVSDPRKSFLQKPFTKSRLLNKVASILGQRAFT